MQNVYIVSARRTAIGSFLGVLKAFSAVELVVPTILACLKDAKVEPDWVDEVICGHVLSSGTGMGPARQALLAAGIPQDKTAYSLNMLCGSGMRSIADGVSHIRSGDADIVMASGMESMSQAPFLLSHDNRLGKKLGSQELLDSIMKDGLTDAGLNISMGVTAENIAGKFLVSREAQDSYAVLSQRRAGKAQSDGVFHQEIVPIAVNEQLLIADDQFVKKETAFESLALLRPSFKAQGTVTAGNSSGINDGASSVLLASAAAVKQYNLKPMAEILSIGQAGVSPEYMGMGPIPAIKNALLNAHLKLSDIDLFEINEAFAAQTIAVKKALVTEHEIDESWLDQRCNVNGGAIALGHPLGASGNRIVVSLIHEMAKRQVSHGLATLCIGGGMGIAIIIKLVQGGNLND